MKASLLIWLFVVHCCAVIGSSMAYGNILSYLKELDHTEPISAQFLVQNATGNTMKDFILATPSKKPDNSMVREGMKGLSQLLRQINDTKENLSNATHSLTNEVLKETSNTFWDIFTPVKSFIFETYEFYIFPVIHKTLAAIGFGTISGKYMSNVKDAIKFVFYATLGVILTVIVVGLVCFGLPILVGCLAFVLAGVLVLLCTMFCCFISIIL